MSEILSLSWEDVAKRADVVAQKVCDRCYNFGSTKLKVYGIPRGGILAALLLQAAMERHAAWQTSTHRTIPNLKMVNSVAEADFIFDDIYDSGKTISRHAINHPWFVLVHKHRENLMGHWVEFHWEVASEESGQEENIVRLLQFIEEERKREWLMETLARVIKYVCEIYADYKQETKD